MEAFISKGCLVGLGEASSVWTQKPELDQWVVLLQRSAHDKNGACSTLEQAVPGHWIQA